MSRIRNTQKHLVEPHGGSIVQRIVSGDEAIAVRAKLGRAPRISISDRTAGDLACIGIGAFSPLSGFMGQHDYEACIESMRLASGIVWPIPIVLPVDKKTAESLRPEGVAALVNTKNELIGSVDIEEVYPADKEREARGVYGTTDQAHPGVAALFDSGNMYIAGKISLLQLPASEFPAYALTPTQTRNRFVELGWGTVVGFQTRNPVHRAHEYLQKVALEIVDGLLLHPLVGTTKDDDLSATVRMRCYEALLKGYYPRDRVLLSVYQAPMRYAGPREAVLHAIARKNYGCSHFIVGRDHAGVGAYYGPFDAQKIFDDLEEELGIHILRFDNAFFCRSCSSMATLKTCPHPPDAHVVLSGTKVRELLRAGQRPPAEFSRPEIADILIEALAPGDGYKIAT